MYDLQKTAWYSCRFAQDDGDLSANGHDATLTPALDITAKLLGWRRAGIPCSNSLWVCSWFVVHSLWSFHRFNIGYASYLHWDIAMRGAHARRREYEIKDKRQWLKSLSQVAVVFFCLFVLGILSKNSREDLIPNYCSIARQLRGPARLVSRWVGACIWIDPVSQE